MARIAFFTERLPPDADPITRFSYDLMTSLADQQHEVRVFSTYFDGAELPAARPRLEIVRPFRRWNWLEVPRAIPVLMEFRPEILHFIQPRAETQQGLTNALTAIHALLPLLGRPAVVSTFFDLNRQSLRRQNLLLQASDAITVMNSPQLTLIEEFFKISPPKKQPLTAVLPAPSSGQRLTGHDESFFNEEVAPEALSSFTENSDFIFVPGEVSDHVDPRSLFEAFVEPLQRFSRAKVVFGGGWGSLPPRQRHELMKIFESRGLGARVYFTGPLTPAVEKFCLENSRLVLTASLPPESLQLTRLLRDALQTSAALLLSREQAELDPLPWKDHEHAFIAESDSASWSKVLNEALASEEVVENIRKMLPEFTRSEVVDQPGNVVSRVYSQVLASRGS